MAKCLRAGCTGEIDGDFCDVCGRPPLAVVAPPLAPHLAPPVAVTAQPSAGLRRLRGHRRRLLQPVRVRPAGRVGALTRLVGLR